ncbi:MAG: DnaJ domain-containing protein [Chitinophagaceae bacterium]
MIDAFPLQWPIGYKRTVPGQRKRSPFKQTMDRAQRFLRDEIARLGGRELVVSSDIPVRNDGMFYADYMKRRIDDPGVAIYFKYKGKDVSMCCDQYNTVWENAYALGKGIEALRGMERWGVSEFLDRAFTGFKAIEEKSTAIDIVWWGILNISPHSNQETIKSAYRRLVAQYHPDNKETGNAEKFIQVKTAYDQAMNSQ